MCKIKRMLISFVASIGAWLLFVKILLATDIAAMKIIAVLLSPISIFGYIFCGIIFLLFCSVLSKKNENKDTGEIK